MSIYSDYGYNPIRNRDCINSGDSFGPSYNAVIDVKFSEESATEPVTLQEAKDWCRVDVADDDALITELIKSARVICELYSNISFITRTVTAIIHNGLGRIRLPYGPLNGEVVYSDEDNIEMSDYLLRTPDDGDTTAVYNAGYEYPTLPKNLKNALLNQIAFMLENRGDLKIQSNVSEESKLILNQVRSV